MYNKLIKNEYIVTNGIGGFSSSSLTGANTRKYHSILNASLNPPVNRTILLSRVLTNVKVGNETYTLESTEYPDKITDNSIFTKSFNYLPIPTFNYEVEDVKITKMITMKYRENTSAIKYEVTTGKTPTTISCDLHVNLRDHHDLSTPNSFQYKQSNKGAYLTLDSGEISFNINGFGTYKKLDMWSDTEFYRIEKRRGQDDLDTNYIPGSFEVTVPPYTVMTLGIVASTETIIETADELVELEIKRRDILTETCDDIETKLQIACDHFIVDRKSTNSKTVIAGYPWFTDWGRDTMIALPGLTLSTGRYDDAKDIIRTFIKYEKDGLIPNMFPDNNIEPMYNTIDGTLWLFIAVFQYYNETKDKEFIIEIFPTLNRIIQKHIEGTSYNIHVDQDGLLTGGDETTQLTWMDVKIDGHVVTPRHGKAVEINALWYNALNIMSYFSKDLCLHSKVNFDGFADKCYESFNLSFWNEDKNCLYDLIQNGQPIDRIRPNQIFAVSLPYGLLDEEKEMAVINVVEKELLTPNGLRSLSRDHEEYEPIYDGDVYKRDYAYHQGTVWGWLIGPYLEAHYNVYNDKKYILGKLNLFLKHLEDTGMGTISEVFSGDEPHSPRGCFGQAWSVSEPMRIYQLIKK